MIYSMIGLTRFSFSGLFLTIGVMFLTLSCISKFIIMLLIQVAIGEALPVV